MLLGLPAGIVVHRLVLGILLACEGRVSVLRELCVVARDAIAGNYGSGNVRRIVATVARFRGASTVRRRRPRAAIPTGAFRSKPSLILCTSKINEIKNRFLFGV